jgi:MFS family permease
MATQGVPADERGAVVGTTGVFLDVAFGLSPAVLGLIAASTGYPPTFLISSVIAAIGAGYLLIRRPGQAGRTTGVGHPV